MTAARVWSKIICGRDERGDGSRKRLVARGEGNPASREGRAGNAGERGGRAKIIIMAARREDFILMIVGGLTLDPTTKMPIVVLKDPDNKLNLPIWIGPLEAASMATELEGIRPQRPMTHDLLRNLLGDLGATVEAVEVTFGRNRARAAHQVADLRGQESARDVERAARSGRRARQRRRSESGRRLARQVVGNPRADVARGLQVQDVSAAAADL